MPLYGVIGHSWPTIIMNEASAGACGQGVLAKLFYTRVNFGSPSKREELLNNLKDLLKPGGQIGISTALRGVTPSFQVFRTHIPQNLMSFFHACHEGFEGLPLENEMLDLLKKTGFIEIEAIPLPFKVSHYFFARKPWDKKLPYA